MHALGTDPRDFFAKATLGNGTEVTIRHVRVDDRDRFERAFRNLERESVYTRFFRYVDQLTEEDLTRAIRPDPEREVALVVTTSAGTGEVIIAGARYVDSGVIAERRSAEVAFMVEEDYQGLGIAARLLKTLGEIGRGQGITEFEADVLAGNKSMLAVFARSGLKMQQRREGGVVHVTLSLGAPQ